jgi:hypothetical protein
MFNCISEIWEAFSEINEISRETEKFETSQTHGRNTAEDQFKNNEIEIQLTDKENRLEKLRDLYLQTKRFPIQGQLEEYQRDQLLSVIEKAGKELVKECDSHIPIIEDFCTEITNLFEKHEESQDERPHAKILNTLTHKIKHLSYSGLRKARTRLFELKKSEDLPYDIWVNGLVMVLGEMVEREEKKIFNTGEDLENSQGLFCRFLAMQYAMATVVDDFTIAEETMATKDNNSMEDTIDMKRNIENLAKANKVSLAEAYSIWEEKQI